ncbi:rab11 family-interacting protein 1 [Xyrichtys novacula]|nr:rab11 family-interacting protein 1 [Xyrichtys novacula]
MMSLIDLDDDQRWVPTHVNVTVLRARGLRTKGKHGSRYLYTIIQVGKEKYTTGLVEKAEVPEWNEECCFELLPGILEDGGRNSYPPGSGDLVLTVMHRVLIGLDVFLGQTIIPLDKIFQEGMCPRDEWFKLNSKAGRKEKERGELQVTVQFTRNNMTASMFDLTMKDKPRSAFGKLKDRVTGKKRGDMESSSAIVPGRYAALSGSLGQPFGEDGAEPVESRDVEIVEEKRSKVKDFFKGRLRKSSDTRSCSSLASDSSVSSMASENPGPPPSLDLMSDPPSSPIYSSKVRVDTHYGETDLAKKVLTSQHTTRVLTHKRAFSDEASKITTAFPKSNPALESLKGQTMTQSKSSLCINGSHVYDSEPSTPRASGAHPSKLVLLEKCSPLSRSLQNITKRSEDKGLFSEGRRWSFDKVKKDEREEEKEAQSSSSSSQQAQTGGRPNQTTTPVISSASGSPEKGRKLRMTLFSGARSESLPTKSDLNQSSSTSEGRLRGWFASGDSQNKPRLEVSPKVESSSEVPPPLPPRSPVPPQYPSPPSASPSGHVSPDDYNHTNPFTPSPASTPLSPSNPFPSHHNPFFEELIAEEALKSPTFASCYTPSSSPFHYTTVPSRPCTLSPAHNVNATNMTSIKRERPRPVARQVSLPAILPKAGNPNSSNHSAPCSMLGSSGEWDDSFDAFASSRLNSPKGNPSQPRTSPTSSHTRGYPPVNTKSLAQELQACEEEPPPLPPRRPLRNSVNEIYSDGWLHRGQALAVHKEAYLLSQTGVASLQRGKEGELKRNSVSPDPHTSSGTSDSHSLHSQPYTNVTSPEFVLAEKNKKFKYEPLEDNADCLGGMLFEQDLYGRMCRGNYGQPRINSHLLLLTAEEARNKITSTKLLDSEISVADLLHLSTGTPSKLGGKIQEIKPTPVEENELDLPENECINNNVSFSLTLGDLNMNVNNSDFGFIDSDGSSQSEVLDTLKGINSFTQLPEDTHAFNTETDTTPEDMFTLKDTYIPEMNSSFEIIPSNNKLCKVYPICQDNCQDCRHGLNNPAPHGNSRVTSEKMNSLASPTGTSNPLGLEFDSRQHLPGSGSIKAQKDSDDNGNPQGTVTKTESFSGVVSARLRPKGLSGQSNCGSPIARGINSDREFEQLLSLVQNISRVSEGPLSYQPTKSALSSLLSFNKHSDLQEDSTKNQDLTNHNEPNKTPDRTMHQNCIAGKSSSISFEDLHAKVAPSSRTPSKTKIGQSLQDPELSSLSTPCTSSLSADAQVKLPSTPVCCPSKHPSSTGPSAGAGTTLAVAPFTTTTSSSYSTTSTTDQPLVDARHSLLPEETQPASNLPHQESR